MKLCHSRPSSRKNLPFSSQPGSYLTASSCWPSEPTPFSATTMCFLGSPQVVAIYAQCRAFPRSKLCSETPHWADFIRWTSCSEALSSLSCFLPTPPIIASSLPCPKALLISPASSFVPGCLLRWYPMIPASWHSCLYVAPSSWILAGPSDSLLTNRNQQQWQAVTLEIRLPQTGTLVLLALSCFLSHLLTPMRQAALLWAALRRGKKFKVGCSLWPSVALSAIICKELNPANYHTSEPGRRSCSIWAFKQDQNFTDALQWVRCTQLPCTLILDP